MDENICVVCGQFSGYGELKRPGVSRLGALDTPERVAFATKCLAAAGQARRIYIRYSNYMYVLNIILLVR
jgi:hypothetical protein